MDATKEGRGESRPTPGGVLGGVNFWFCRSLTWACPNIGHIRLVLKVWFPEEYRQHRLGTCHKSKLLGPTRTHWIRKSWVGAIEAPQVIESLGCAHPDLRSTDLEARLSEIGAPAWPGSGESLLQLVDGAAFLLCRER